MGAVTNSLDGRAIESDAATILADALAQTGALHFPGARQQYRAQLERAIAVAQSVVSGALTESQPADAKTIARALTTLAKAHAARAEDARHGAGQLSLGSQRAPTREDCDDGWQRVEGIVATAEASAREAARIAAELDTEDTRNAARAAEKAAADARRIVHQRNHAYTFHADPAFSFGEGWYLGAAAVLVGDVAIQVEPDKTQTTQAERFLRDAGLGPRVQPYRSRPRANKHLPAIVGQAFGADPLHAQRQLRAAFLGDVSPAIPQAIVEWTDRAVGAALSHSAPGTSFDRPQQKKVLLWVRYGAHHAIRNTIHAELVELILHTAAIGLVPVLVGDAVRDGALPSGAIDMTLFWKQPLFQGEDMRRAQLHFFEHLRRAHGLVGQLGVTTAGMDGPALMGLPTMYFTDAPNVRMLAWVGTVPNYEEIVRTEGYLQRVSDTLKRWARTP